MKKLKSGSIISIPLLFGLGYLYAKYIDLTKLTKIFRYPDLLKVYTDLTDKPVQQPELLSLKSYLLSPILVAGLRPTLNKGLWNIIGQVALSEEDQEFPEFKSGCSSYEEIAKGNWFLYRDGDISNKTSCEYDQVKYLQPLAAMGTGNIEVQLTMHSLLSRGKNIEAFFDLTNENYNWNYTQVNYSPRLS